MGLVLLGQGAAWGEDNWMRFRGPEGTGHSQDAAIPVSWDESAVKWRVDLPGRGQSSPVNFGNRLFLTAANPDGTRRQVLCYSCEDGELLWSREVEVAQPETPHRMNSFATPTCVTDGERVVAFFGPGGLHAYDLDGNPLWSRQLGEFPGPWGVAASPVIDGGRVIQNADAQGTSWLMAFDVETGEELWRTPRQDLPRGGWSTPIFIAFDGRREMVLNGEFGVRGYDPETGEEWWFCRGFNGRGSPVPDFAHGILYVVNGKPGDTYAVRPGGRGDVTETHMVWHAEREGGRDLSSPAVVGDHVFIVTMSGIAMGYDAHSGDVHFKERLDGAFSASPLVANGLIYLTTEQGKVLVVKPGESLELVAENPLGADRGEIFRSTPAPIRGDLYIRSDRALYRVGR